MRLFHRTPPEVAAAILRSGFVDCRGGYLTDEEHEGVWLSDRPLDGNEGAYGDSLVAAEIEEEAIAAFEWIEEGKPYREWLVPASLLNAKARISPACEES